MSHLPKQELSPAWSSPFHHPTRISCREPRSNQGRSKTLSIPLLEQSEGANPNPMTSHPKPAASGQLECSNPPGQHVPSLKLNQQLMNISQRQTGQVDRVNLLFMSIGGGEGCGQSDPGSTRSWTSPGEDLTAKTSCMADAHPCLVGILTASMPGDGDVPPVPAMGTHSRVPLLIFTMAPAQGMKQRESLRKTMWGEVIPGLGHTSKPSASPGRNPIKTPTFRLN